MKKSAVKIKFKFNAKNIDELTEVDNFVTASAGIPELNLGATPLPAQAQTYMNSIKAKHADVVAAHVYAKKMEEELTNLMSDFADIIAKMQTSAALYIDDDNVKAAVLSATVEPVQNKKMTSLPERPSISHIYDGAKPGSVKIKLEGKVKGATSYQVQYTTNYNQPNAITTLYPVVFTGVYSIELVGLKRAEEIGFEVRGSNSNGPGAWSDVGFKVVS